MTDSSISGLTGASSATSAAKSNQNAFADADFLSIMLTEVTNQDPLAPSDTSKMVESMRQLQVLANTASEKFRADVTWAQQMVGSMVNVTQVAATAAEKESYINAGLNPDIGFGNKDIRVQGFRVVDQQVWLVTEEGRNYPIDNIKQVMNDRFDTKTLTETATRMLGMRVGYLSGIDGTQRSEGVVSSVGYDSDGSVVLGINNAYVKYDNIISVTVPDSAASGG